MRWLDGITQSMDTSLSWEIVKDRACSPWGGKDSDTTERLNNKVQQTFSIKGQRVNII